MILFSGSSTNSDEANSNLLRPIDLILKSPPGHFEGPGTPFEISKQWKKITLSAPASRLGRIAATGNTVSLMHFYGSQFGGSVDSQTDTH